jgi:hypothetical protein
MIDSQGQEGGDTEVRRERDKNRGGICSLTAQNPCVRRELRCERTGDIGREGRTHERGHPSAGDGGRLSLRPSSLPMSSRFLCPVRLHGGGPLPVLAVRIVV